MRAGISLLLKLRKRFFDVLLGNSLFPQLAAYLRERATPQVPQVAEKRRA
jgi:hypothetical protein